MMNNVTTLKRFIDDGSGFFAGTKRQFSDWINKVNAELSPFGLNIDEHTIAEHNEPVAFLDIQFCFDKNSQLQTDLYTKPTDARSYLQYGSAHPNHIYSGIVFSQCLRLRRIINCNERLKTRLDELSAAFLNSNYPTKMVSNIINKVLHTERRLPNMANTSNSSILLPSSPDKSIRVITTFGADQAVLDIAAKFEPDLCSSPSFSSASKSTVSRNGAHPINSKKLFKYVKRTGSSLRNKLVKVKNMALNRTHGRTRPCNRKNAKCCMVISEEERFVINGRVVKAIAGNCTNYNVIYCFQCLLCRKYYVGRTVQILGNRIGQHRRFYYEILGDVNTILSNDLYRDNDDYSLGFHLVDCHNLVNKCDFNNSYRVFILDICSPKMLEVQEHKFIQSLKTLKPYGINAVDPFGIPHI